MVGHPISVPIGVEITTAITPGMMIESSEIIGKAKTHGSDLGFGRIAGSPLPGLSGSGEAQRKLLDRNSRCCCESSSADFRCLIPQDETLTGRAYIK